MAVYAKFEGQKLRGQLFKRTQQSKKGQRVVWCVTWICVQVFQLFFFLKYNVSTLPGQYQKYLNAKNIKTKPPCCSWKKDYEIVFVFKNQKPSKSLSTQLYHSLKKRIVWNTGRTGRSTHLCWEPSWTRTHSSLPGIKM